MKKAIFFSATALMAVIFFAACKKDDASGPTTLQRLQAKWNFQKEYYHESYAGSPDYRDTTYGPVTDYVDFRADNKVYSHMYGAYDTASYVLISNDTKIERTYGTAPFIYKDTLDIQVLTSNAFQFYSKVFDPAPDYYEYTDYFTK